MSIDREALWHPGAPVAGSVPPPSPPPAQTTSWALAGPTEKD